MLNAKAVQRTKGSRDTTHSRSAWTVGLFALALVAMASSGRPQETQPSSPTADGPDRSALGALRYDAALADVGRVLHYRHSNVDGTRASRVSLYWAAPNRLESLKWSPGWKGSTLVVADMDWETFSVKGFETFQVAADGKRSSVARLETRDGELVAGGGSIRCEIESLPWHSYDFDLASLNVSLRFFIDPTAPFTFAIADAIRSPTGVTFGFKGDVEMIFVGEEEREGLTCRKYSIEGPGFEFRGGHLWVAKSERPHFVDFEFDLPDEPGMTSGKLTLLESADLTTAEWQAFVEGSVR